MSAQRTARACRTALYLRLSRDDDGAQESASIASQRSQLLRFAAEHGYAVAGEYVDDGYSGTSFARPGFLALIADIEEGAVDLVLVKDLSRLGRDYLVTGQYTEVYFPSKGVRCIAVDDGYDSAGAGTDIAPLRNVLNEMYARDISRKIRSALRARMRDGAFVGSFAPYGYRKDPLDKHRLLPDPVAAPVVRELFALAAAGSTPGKIAARLNAAGIPSPSAARRIAEKRPPDNEDASGRWTSSGVSKILHNEVYLGRLAQGKTARPSIKNRACVRVQEPDWIVAEDAHEPLADAETFALAARRCAERLRPREGRFSNLFSGIAFCADCGLIMSAVGSRRRGAEASLVCGGYKRRGRAACTSHGIDYSELKEIVLAALQTRCRPDADEAQFLVAAALTGADGAAAKAAHELAALDRRRRELDAVIASLYEDRCRGAIGDARFFQLLAAYEAEAETLDRTAALLRRTAAHVASPAERDASDSAEDALRRLLGVPELTRELLLAFVERIEVGQGRYEKTERGRVKRQRVTIRFRFATPESEEEICLPAPEAP